MDLDAVEHSHGNTALHLICMHSNNPEMIELLLKSGCHIDCVNKDGRIPFDYIEDPELRIFYSSRVYPSKLKCLCAHLIAKEQLDMTVLGASTPVLNRFVVLHGYHTME